MKQECQFCRFAFFPLTKEQSQSWTGTCVAMMDTDKPQMAIFGEGRPKIHYIEQNWKCSCGRFQPKVTQKKKEG